MKTSDMVRELCDKCDISIAELSRRIGQSPQNINKKLNRDTFTLDELNQIASVTGVTFEQSFVFPNGESITIGEDAVVGAASVVTKDIPDYAVAVGNPAKVIKLLDAERCEAQKG